MHLTRLERERYVCQSAWCPPDLTKPTFSRFAVGSLECTRTWTQDLGGLEAAMKVSYSLGARSNVLELTFNCLAEPGEPDDSKGSRSCTDADDHVALSVQRVVSADGAAQYVGTLTVDDGLPVKLTLFRRIVAVSGGHTEESAKLSAYNDCLRFCYYYNRLDPFADTGMKSDA